VGEVDSMVESNPIDTTQVYPGDFQEWANQSYNEAVNYVYPGKYSSKAGENTLFGRLNRIFFQSLTIF